jgi:hypothetical protein
MPYEKDLTSGVSGLPASVRRICLPLLAALACLVGLWVKCDAVNAKESSMANDCQVTVYTRNIIHPEFGGVGFHMFCHAHPIAQTHLKQVIAKRWREMNPSFARLNDSANWDRDMLDKVDAHLLRLKETGTVVYMTTWDPAETQAGEERRAYAKKVVGNLEYLIREKGATNIKYYCMTNELSLKGWGALRNDMPKFRDYHREIFEEIKARSLDIKLLASDASPISFWDTIKWSAENMDDITGIYGGHHYINDYAPEDEEFYAWFLKEVHQGVKIARDRGKSFILGEFGCKQDGRTIDGIKRDVCIYWDTPQEPMVGIQLCEAAIAAINAGVYALGNWTFTDFPDSYHKSYINKWGTFRWSGDDYSTRAHYYAYGLLTRFFRGPATVFEVESGDALLRISALRHYDRGTYSIAVINRKKEDVPLTVTLDGDSLNADFRKYVYDPENVPYNPFGDLQPPEGKIVMNNGRLTDIVGGVTLTVYTTAYDEDPPAVVEGLVIEANPEGGKNLKWQANSESDFCYYRIHRSADRDFSPALGNQIGTTVATEFTDGSADSGGEHYYRVVAVDQSGNVSQ